MKKKIFFGMAALFFAAITFYNVQVSQQDGDISLENVALMAQANTESGWNPLYKEVPGDTACTYLKITYKYNPFTNTHEATATWFNGKMSKCEAGWNLSCTPKCQ